MRLWSNYALSLEYLGGVGNYNVRGIGIRQVEELGFTRRSVGNGASSEFEMRSVISRRAPSGVPTESQRRRELDWAGISVFFGGSTSTGSALGQVPRIMNLTVVDVVETLTPKSSITVPLGYGFVHFLVRTNPGQRTAFIGNSQVLGSSRL